jgi:hypothetical protein
MQYEGKKTKIASNLKYVYVLDEWNCYTYKQSHLFKQSQRLYLVHSYHAVTIVFFSLVTISSQLN